MGTADIDADKLLVDMAVDDSLPRAERAALRERLAGDEALRREERELGRLQELLAAGRVVARPGFTEEVMMALPETAPWAARRSPCADSFSQV